MASRSSRRTGRPAIIVSHEGPEWGSCKIITPNLEKAYRGVFGEDANYFSFTAQMPPGDIWILAEKIFESRPDRLVFLDHMPHPGALIRALEVRYGKKGLPPIYVHVYGDFTIYSGAWLHLHDVLAKTHLEFICASERQAKLVSRFLSEPIDAVHYCPFPVDRAHYSSSEALRTKTREEMKITHDELVLLYTGRLSLQKNSIRLLQEVLKFAEESEKKVRFLVAGSFDDLGAPFFGINLRKGYYFQKWRAALDMASPDADHTVEYVGQVGAQRLLSLYNAADVYLSLSLHHDEDYGMSPAEALCSGTPCALTSWGGYSSFVHPDRSKNAVQLIDVNLGPNGIGFPSKSVQASLHKQAKADNSPAARKARSEAYLDLLSIEAAQKRIEKFHEVLPPIFGGFNWLMERHAELYSKSVMFPAGPKKGTFYEEIYGAYIQG